MQLIKILKVLSSTKEEQINFLLNLGTFPYTDELALDFDDAYKVFLGNIAENNEDTFGETFLNNLKEINLIFTEMSNIPHNSFWKTTSLNLTNWNKIRIIAKDSLLISNIDKS